MEAQTKKYGHPGPLREVLAIAQPMLRATIEICESYHKAKCATCPHKKQQMAEPDEVKE